MAAAIQALMEALGIARAPVVGENGGAWLTRPPEAARHLTSPMF
jgi:hypothetical protein